MSRRLDLIVVALAMLGVGSLSACRPDDQRTDSVNPETAGRTGLSDAAVVQLDSGNTAYSERSFEAALRHYVRVTEMAPDQPTGWFGIYMAQHALGNIPAADSALQRAQDLAPGASLIRPPADSGGGTSP